MNIKKKKKCITFCARDGKTYDVWTSCYFGRAVARATTNGILHKSDMCAAVNASVVLTRTQLEIMKMIQFFFIFTRDSPR